RRADRAASRPSAAEPDPAALRRDRSHDSHGRCRAHPRRAARVRASRLSGRPRFQLRRARILRAAFGGAGVGTLAAVAGEERRLTVAGVATSSVPEPTSEALAAPIAPLAEEYLAVLIVSLAGRLSRGAASYYLRH